MLQNLKKLSSAEVKNLANLNRITLDEFKVLLCRDKKEVKADYNNLRTTTLPKPKMLSFDRHEDTEHREI